MPAEPPAVQAPAPAVREEDITDFIVGRFLPGVDSGELDATYDLLTTAVIDSLGVLEVAAWLEDRYQLTVPDGELVGRNFQSVRAIRATAERAAAGRGAA